MTLASRNQNHRLLYLSVSSVKESKPPPPGSLRFFRRPGFYLRKNSVICADVKEFSEAVSSKSEEEYEVACEHAHSCCVLLGKTDRWLLGSLLAARIICLLHHLGLFMELKKVVLILDSSIKKEREPVLEAQIRRVALTLDFHLESHSFNFKLNGYCVSKN